MVSQLSVALCVEMDLMSIVLLLYVIFKSYNHMQHRKNWKMYVLSMMFIVLFSASDMIWRLSENHVIPNPRWLAFTINYLYFTFCIAGAASWFHYTEEVNDDKPMTLAFQLALWIPLLIAAVFLVINMFTGVVFYIDENNMYSRGPLQIIMFLVPCFHLIFSVLRSLKHAFQRENFAKKRMYINYSCFALFSIVPAGVQILIPETPFSCIGLSVAAVFVYINSLEMLVSIDSLTKVNNRHHMIQYLASKIEQKNRDIPLYLFMIDLDCFKQINDNYGHVEGDNALKDIASILKKTAGKFDCFVARYGGDEFAMICESNKPNIVEEIKTFINEELDSYNNSSNNKYKISVSIGVARYTSELSYIPDFIACADKALYDFKCNKRKK